MGATNRILNAVMTFGRWRRGEDTESMLKLKTQNPIVAGGDRLELSVQGKRALQRLGAAARGQAKPDRISRQSGHIHVRNERQRLEIGLQIRILSNIAHSGHLNIDGKQAAAGGE